MKFVNIRIKSVIAVLFAMLLLCTSGCDVPNTESPNIGTPNAGTSSMETPNAKVEVAPTENIHSVGYKGCHGRINTSWEEFESLKSEDEDPVINELMQGIVEHGVDHAITLDDSNLWFTEIKYTGVKITVYLSADDYKGLDQSTPYFITPEEEQLHVQFHENKFKEIGFEDNICWHHRSSKGQMLMVHYNCLADFTESDFERAIIGINEGIIKSISIAYTYKRDPLSQFYTGGASKSD